jgi:hypothetical protein
VPVSRIHRECCLGVQDVLRNLNLAGMPDDKIVLRRVPIDRDLTPPYIIICPGPGSETLEEGTNAAEDWGYPVTIAIGQAANQDLSVQDEGDGGEYRELCIFALHHQRPTLLTDRLSVPLKRVTVEPGSVLDTELFKENMDVGWFDVRVVVRRVR